MRAVLPLHLQQRRLHGLHGPEVQAASKAAAANEDAWERQSGLSVPPAAAAPPKKERAPKAKQKKVEYYL